MELDSIIHRFASKKVTLLLWAQVRLPLGSEAKRPMPLSPGPSRLSDAQLSLLLALLSAGRGRDRGATVPAWLKASISVQGGLLLVGLAFTPAVGSWVLALGTLNPASDHYPSSQARCLCYFTCCPGPRPHLAKDCPHSTNGLLCQLSQWPHNSLGPADHFQSILEAGMYLISVLTI